MSAETKILANDRLRVCEERGSVVYAQCSAYLPRSNSTCTNMVPLDRMGKFSGVCGVCKAHIIISMWWQSAPQRAFKKEKAVLRARVALGEPITLAEFDAVAKEYQ